MSCEARLPELIDLLAGELEPATAIGLEQHLVDCPECRLEERRLRALFAAAAGAAYEPGDAARAVFRRERRAPRLPLLRLAAAAALLLVAGGAFWLGRQSAPPTRVDLSPAVHGPAPRDHPLKFVSAPPEVVAWSVPERGDSL